LFSADNIVITNAKHSSLLFLGEASETKLAGMGVYGAV